jgi:hypothetical protein
VDDPEEEAGAGSLGQFIKRSKPAKLTLYLDVQLPGTYLSALLSTSGSYISKIDITSPLSLPLETPSELVIPVSITRIHCQEEGIEEERLDLVCNLRRRLEEPQRQIIVVTFGAGGISCTVNVN